MLHTHQPWTTALAMQDELHLAPISQTSLQFTDRVVYDERYEGLADLDEGERLAKVLGEAEVMFLRHHGILVAGRELGAAMDDLYMLEKAAQLQVLAIGARPAHADPRRDDRAHPGSVHRRRHDRVGPDALGRDAPHGGEDPARLPRLILRSFPDIRNAFANPATRRGRRSV